MASDPVMSPQVRLAETLAGADAIDWVRASGTTITFAIDRDGQALRVVARTGAHGTVLDVTVSSHGAASVEPGQLGWLAGELLDVTAVTNLVTDPSGPIVIVTDDDRHYLAIPGREANIGVESRWAAAWDTTEATR